MPVRLPVSARKTMVMIAELSKIGHVHLAQNVHDFAVTKGTRRLGEIK